MPYKKGKRVKRRTHKETIEDLVDGVEAPRSLVFCKGKVGGEVNQLMHEWREAMLPYTAERLKVVKRNKIKDIMELSKLYKCNTSHVFTCSPSGTNFRVLKSPQGPTLTFKVESFKLKSDILKEGRRQHMVTDSTSFSKPPLVVFNQFSNVEKHHQLVTTTFQGMFPNIVVDTFKLTHCHRVLLVNYNKAHDVIEMRHYGILARTSGVSTVAKKLSRNIVPKKMGDMASVEELFKKGGDYLSDTDGEGEEVELTQNFRKMASGSQTRLKLTEIGPRMTLSLTKVESGYWGGETIYHRIFSKTPEEMQETERRIKARERLKALRKKEQDANVAKKKAAEDAKKDAKKRKREKAQKGGEEEGSDNDYEVVCDGEGPVSQELENAEEVLEGEATTAQLKRPKVTFDTEDAQVTEINTPQFVEEPPKDIVPPKKRKPITRQMRQQIKHWKKAENQRDEY